MRGRHGAIVHNAFVTEQTVLVSKWGKGKSALCWWDRPAVQPRGKTVGRGFKNVRIELPDDPAIPLLGIYGMPMTLLTQKDICSPTLTGALITVAGTWKQLKCPWVNAEDEVHVYNGILLSRTKK